MTRVSLCRMGGCNPNLRSRKLRVSSGTRGHETVHQGDGMSKGKRKEPLKACPFCGRNATYRVGSVRCTHCGAMMPTHGGYRGKVITAAEARVLWNRRVIEVAQVDKTVNGSTSTGEWWGLTAAEKQANGDGDKCGY